MDCLEQEVAALRTENELLKEQLARTSANSSLPPSKNPQGFKPNRKEPTGKKRGGQAGHQKYERKLYPLEMCQEVIDHYPEQCSKCRVKFNGHSSAEAYRHRAAHESEETSDYAKHFQIIEVPPVQPIVIEQRKCAGGSFPQTPSLTTNSRSR